MVHLLRRLYGVDAPAKYENIDDRVSNDKSVVFMAGAARFNTPRDVGDISSRQGDIL